MIQKNAMAAQHVVGGSQGWDESADFKSWASGQTFKVGDTLGLLLIYFSSLLQPKLGRIKVVKRFLCQSWVAF